MHPKGDDFFQVHFKHSEIYFSVEYQTPFVWTVSSEKSMFEESYRAAKMMLGAESYWKDIKSEKENGGMSYEDTVRKLQEKFGLTEEDAEQKMKACWKVG